MTRVVNNMLTIALAPLFFGSEEEFAREAERFMAYVKTAERTDPDAEILMPGEPEERTRARRLRDGIDLDDTTWKQLQETCRSLNVPS